MYIKADAVLYNQQLFFLNTATTGGVVGGTLSVMALLSVLATVIAAVVSLESGNF